MAEEEVSLGELRRNIQDMRIDSERVAQEIRQDTQRSLNNMQRSIDKMADGFERLPYVRADLYDERQKANGERMGQMEKEINGVKTTLSKVNWLVWTAVILPITVAVFLALFFAAVNIKP